MMRSDSWALGSRRGFRLAVRRAFAAIDLDIAQSARRPPPRGQTRKAASPYQLVNLRVRKPHDSFEKFEEVPRGQ